MFNQNCVIHHRISLKDCLLNYLRIFGLRFDYHLFIFCGVMQRPVDEKQEGRTIKYTNGSSKCDGEFRMIYISNNVNFFSGYFIICMILYYTIPF